jgi:hypothetical protein
VQTGNENNLHFSGKAVLSSLTRYIGLQEEKILRVKIAPRGLQLRVGSAKSVTNAHQGPKMTIFNHFMANFFKVIWFFRAIVFTLLFIILIGAMAIAFVEKIPLGDALYFSFVTGLTIGYGDIVVKTALGRCVALFIGFIGIVFTGLVIAGAVEAVRRTYHH